MDTDGKAADTRREERRQAMLDAAESLFLEKGFDRVSLAEVVKRSSGSLATLYELFGNKHGLLREVIRQGKAKRFAALETLIPSAASPAAVLRLIAEHLRNYLMTPHAVAMIRIVIAESLRDPDFGRDFHKEHREQLRALADLFREWDSDGKATIDDPDAAAELFHAMMTSDAQLNALVGAHGSEGIDPCEKQMLWRLNLFIRHFRIAEE